MFLPSTTRIKLLTFAKSFCKTECWTQIISYDNRWKINDDACAEKLIEAIKPFYSEVTTTENQKAFLETIMVLQFVFPHGKTNWNNKVSKNAMSN